MYVAMTRARHELTMSYALISHEYGRQLTQTRSRFFDEMQRPDDPNVIDFSTIEDSSFKPANAIPKLAWSSQTRAKPAPASHGYFECADPPVRSFGKKKPAFQDGFVPDTFYEEDAIDIHADRSKAVERAREPEPIQVPDNTVATSRNGRIIKIGTIVNHNVHGRGDVVKLEKTGNDYKATVAFRKAGVRTIIARFLDVL